jgi:hypothetical protein
MRLPFLVWVNENLANAEAIALCGTPDRITWARPSGRSAGVEPDVAS